MGYSQAKTTKDPLKHSLLNSGARLTGFQNQDERQAKRHVYASNIYVTMARSNNMPILYNIFKGNNSYE